MPGYYKRPDLTAAGHRRWMAAHGDMGYVDDAGYLYLVTARKD
jgi:acyl-CoA synthetase (AMP-forming)/AMP-acid ligase II